MKKNVSIVGVAVTAFILTMAFSYVHPMSVDAKEQCKIITIEAKSQKLPVEFKVSAGDCVIWWNLTGTAGHPMGENDVFLTFEEGEKCLKATRSPVGFNFEAPSGCFISQWLRYGETVSLIFTKPGAYPYEVESRKGPKLEGEIVVVE